MSFDFKVVNGDLVIGPNGDLDIVENTDKLIQDILKILLTPVGTNIFFPWYGSLLSSAMIGSPMEDEFIQTAASMQISNSLQTLQTMQRDQLSSFQRVTASEMLAAIKEVAVERSQVDPTYYSISVRVLTKDLKTATAAFEVTL